MVKYLENSFIHKHFSNVKDMFKIITLYFIFTKLRFLFEVYISRNNLDI